MEASFYVTEDALKRVQPNMRFDETGLLGAFDSKSRLIYATAAKVYARGAEAPTIWSEPTSENAASSERDRTLERRVRDTLTRMDWRNKSDPGIDFDRI